MTRKRFAQLVAEALDSLPERFRREIHNVAVLIEDYPGAPGQRRSRGSRPPRRPDPARSRLMGVFVGVPLTQRSVFQLPTGPSHIVLYQKNIEAVCRGDAEIRHEVRQTVMHELGHYFGMTEEQLRDV